MALFETRERKDILSIVNHLISKSLEISTEIKGSDDQFTTRVIKVKGGSEGNQLIIEKFYPDTGNSLIQTNPDVRFSFEVSGRMCFFNTQYLGINTQYPEFGLIVGFPDAVKIEEKRSEARVHSDLTRFLSAEFTVEGESYHLRVINLGSRGIGLVVDKENVTLLDKVNVGDTIRDMKFFLQIATLTTDGIIKHKTQIDEGSLKGSYVLGIQSETMIDLSELEQKLKD